MSDTGMTEVRVAAGTAAAYAVCIGAGAWSTLPDVLARRAPAHRYAVIADSTVAGLYADRVLGLLGAAGVAADHFLFPAGEENKNRAEWARLSDALLAAGYGRDAVVLALGGGVAGDLAGFVAATFMRGIPVVQLPTSLLAMVDASVGGKTGVDTPAGKNLIGAFHPPRAVLADVTALGTLPLEQLRSGLAEAVKHGAIADAAHLAWIEGAAERLLHAEPQALTELIVRSVGIKAAVVARDEREAGPRKTLNFGHTLGHAVEMLSGFRLLHGEAVAIGMVAEARLGEQLGHTAAGTADRLARLLRRLGLPTNLPPEFTPRQVLAATRTDKKARAGRVEYALLRGVGSAADFGGRWGVPVADREVLAALDS